MSFEKNLQEKITYYSPNHFFEWLDDHLQGVRIVKDVKKIWWFNCASAFDIETSSFFDHGEKKACMYLWAFGLNGGTLYGRTWEEFENLCNQLSDILGLNENRHFIIYVHNLAYEFQWIRKRFQWENVFALKERKPVKAMTTTGIEFRCSYLLSGYSLAKLGDQLKKYPVEKAVGDLNYDLIRHSETPITEKELHYQANDARVVMAYIQEQIEKEKYITNIPITKTSYVRRYCREHTLYIPGTHHKLNRSYKTIMNSLTLDPDEYNMLKNAFAGGFTHANAFYVRKTQYNVSSYDFTSSYPAVMVAKQYPMSRGKLVKPENEEKFREFLNNYCCLFNIELTGVSPRLFYDHPISVSKCFVKENVQQDNGRIVTADRIITTITEQDFFTFEQFYTWENMRIGKMYVYQKGYLPTNFVKSILKLYEGKTTLKNVKGKEAEYLNSKEMLNACFGMAVTDIVRDEIIYTDEWEEMTPANVEKEIDKYNKSKNRFLFYPWGVWVTAHARRALFSGIVAFGSDYIYADTDSIKAINGEKHMDYIKRYNQNIIRELETACEYHGIDKTAIRPKTVKGVEKPLGVWDFEGVYDSFKTLGAKRYIMDESGNLSITIAGVGKKAGAKYLIEKYGTIENVFENFDDGLYFPKGKTGKMTHTYIDDPIDGMVTDYRGIVGEYHEKTCVHLEPADYSLSMFKLFLEYLEGFKYE